MEKLEQEIGQAAGKIWKMLHDKDAMSKAQIAKMTGLSVNLVNQGIGWLAREGKLAREKNKRIELIKLKD